MKRENTDDTISREVAIEAARKCHVKEVTPAYMLIDKAEIMTELMMLPAAQPQRMRGRWIPDNLVGGGYWKCSACKHPTEAFAANVIYDFCPFCGADMREGQDEQTD